MRVRRGILSIFLAGLLAISAQAQESAGPFGGMRHDNSLPIEMTADSLTISQADSSAEFAGNVRIGQGSLHITADKVTVKYAAGEDGATGQIDNIQAFGHVLLTNGAETAEGDMAVYNVATGLVVMTGNVLLTQGNNALSGDSLNINLETGVAGVEGNVKTIFQPGTGQ